MAILIHEYYDLEERSSEHLKKWKVLHTILFIVAAVFGIFNYTFLKNSMYLIDDNCILYPRGLEFHLVKITNYVNYHPSLNNTEEYTHQEDVPQNENKNGTKYRRDLEFTNITTSDDVEVVTINETTAIVGNKTHRLMLDTTRSLFGKEGCEFTEYMPVMATVLAIFWTVLFITCPGGGRTRTGLMQPWRILVPALLFSLVMVGLTGHSFTTTSSGITAFCQAFQNLTGDGLCDSASAYLEHGWNATYGLGPRLAAVQATSVGLWVTWAVAAAVLLARCLTGPDFQVRRTGVLIKDPAKKLMPYLVPLSHSSARSSGRSPSRRDNMSMRSDPTTVTTDLVTATVDIQPDSSLSPALDNASDITEENEKTEKCPQESLQM